MTIASSPATPRDWGLFFFCVALWGMAYTLVEIALNAHAAPLVIVAGRLWMATVMLHAFWIWRRHKQQEPSPTTGTTMKLVGLALTSSVIPFALLSWSQQHIEAGLAGILAAITPLIVAPIAPLLGQDSHLTPARIAGFGIGFAGVIVLMGPEALAGLGGPGFIGQLAAAGAALSYAVNGLLVRTGKPIPPLEASARWTLYGALISTPFALQALTEHGPPDLQGWAAILCLAIGPTALAGVGYFALVARTGPTFVTQTNYAIPLFAVGFGAVVLGERLPPQAFAALALIGLGLFIAQEGWRAFKSKPMSS